MTGEEFGRLKLEELNELRAVWFRREQRLDLRAARICEVLAMAHQGSAGQSLHPADFFPSLEGSRQVPTDEEVAAKVEAWADSYGS